MTAQITEKLHYQGEVMSMCNEPLGDYFKLAGVNPGFRICHTALWRRYVGTWEILEGRLYLVGVNATLENGTKAEVATLFPGFPDRVFAHWYTGQLRLPRGELLEYQHMGYASTYECDLLITIEQGVVTHTEVRQNVPAGMEKLHAHGPHQIKP